MFIDLFSRSSGAQDRSSRPEVRNPLLGLPSAARALEIVRSEMERTLGLIGCARMAEVDARFVGRG